MKTKVSKWGNSLAIRIPQSIAEQVRVDEGSEVEISTDGSEVHFKPTKSYSLDQMLADVSVNNRHQEWDTGSSVGSESW